MSAEDAGQGAARAAGRRSRAARLGADDQGRRPRHRGDEQEPRGRDREGPLPRGSLFPSRRDPDLRAAAARAAGRHRAARQTLHGAASAARATSARSGISPAAHRRAAALSLEGQHPRAAEHRRAAHHHDRRRDDRRRGSAGDGENARAGERASPAEVRAGCSRPAAGETKAGTLREFKDNAERAFLVGKLRENGWNISKTAEAIDTPRSNLYKKLEQYQISQETDG